MNAVYKIININCTIVALSRMIFVRGISERSIFFKFWLKDAYILLIYRYLFQTLPDLTYTRPLTKRQASDYELRPAPDNPDRPRSIREQMKTAAKQVEADRGQSAPKKNAPDRGNR